MKTIQTTQLCDERRLEVGGEWSWLLTAFAGHYGVRSNYAIMSHLRWVLKPGVASVSRGCFDLLSHQMRPLLAQEAMGGSLTQQEVRGGVGCLVVGLVCVWGRGWWGLTVKQLRALWGCEQRVRNLLTQLTNQYTLAPTHPPVHDADAHQARRRGATQAVL